MTIIELAALLAGYALALARLLNAAKPLWSWVPEKAQPLLPALITVLPVLASSLGGVETRLDLAEALLLAFGALTTAVRGVPAQAKAVMLVLALAMGPLQACSPAVKAPSSAQLIEKSTALAFNGATHALLWLDEQEATYLDSLPHPTELQLQQAKLRVDRLARARDALAIVRRALSGELGDLDERGKLREVVEALDLVADEFEANGVALPSELQQALAAARVVL